MTLDDVLQALKNARDAGDTEAVKKLAGIASTMADPQKALESQIPIDYTLGEAFTKAFKRSGKQMGSALFDVLPAMGASALGFKEYAEKQMGEAAKTQEEIARDYPAQFKSYTEVDSPYKALQYGAETLGELAPSALGAMIPGGIAGTVGRGIATRGAMAAAESVGPLSLAGREAAATAAKKVGEEAGRRAMYGGVYLGSYAQNTPEIFQNIYEETGKFEPLVSGLAGGLSSLLDSIVPGRVMDQLGTFGKLKAVEKLAKDSGAAPSVWKAIGKEASSSALKEGLTESAQETISAIAEQVAGSTKDFLSPENIQRYKEAFVKGAIGGAGFGVVGGAGRGFAEKSAFREKQEQERAAQAETARQEQLAGDVAASEKELQAITQAGAGPQMELPGMELGQEYGPSSALVPPTQKVPTGPRVKTPEQLEMFGPKGGVTKAAQRGVSREITPEEKLAADVATSEAELSAIAQAGAGPQMELPGMELGQEYGPSSALVPPTQKVPTGPRVKTPEQLEMFGPEGGVTKAGQRGVSQKVTPTELENIRVGTGAGATARLFKPGTEESKALLGLDLLNPEDAARAKKVLGAYAEGRSETLKKSVMGWVAKNLDPVIKRGAPDATRIDTEAGGAGVGVPVAGGTPGVSTTPTEPSQRGGVDVAGSDVGKPAGGKAPQQGTLDLEPTAPTTTKPTLAPVKTTNEVIATLRERFPQIAEAETENKIAGATEAPPSSEGLAERIKGKPGANVQRLAKMMGPKLYGDPSILAEISVKEMLQNSFDAIKGLKDKIKGKIEINIDRDERTITVIDNGKGMTPQVLANQFLQIAATSKETDRASGGLGIAKMLFLFANEEVTVTTLRDGKASMMKASGPQLFEALENKKLAPDIEIINMKAGATSSAELAIKSNIHEMFPDGHGTAITVRVPEDYVNNDGETEKIPLYSGTYGYPVLTESPLFEDIDVFFNGEQVPIGAAFPIDFYDRIFQAKFDWGVANIYVGREENEREKVGSNVRYLSNGLWQFSQSLRQGPNYDDPNVPRSFYIDLSPKVETEDSRYPIDLNRQRFSKRAENDIDVILRYLTTLYRNEELVKQSSEFGSLEVLRRKENGDVYVSKTIDISPPLTEETITGKINPSDKVEIVDGVMTANGKVVPVLTRDMMKETKVDIANFNVDQSTIPSYDPLVHDNLEVEVRAGEWMPFTKWVREMYGPEFDKMNYEIGKLFIQLRYAASQVMPELEGIDATATGVAYDQKYRGVSLNGAPFKGMFVNPLATRYEDPVRAAAGIKGTMIHEMAHYRERNHSGDFASEMQDILINLESAFPLDVFTNRLREVFAEHNGLLTKLRAVFDNKDRVRPAGKSFEGGSNESISDAASDDRSQDRDGQARPRGDAGGLGGLGERTRGGRGVRGDYGRGTEPSQQKPLAGALPSKTSNLDELLDELKADLILARVKFYETVRSATTLGEALKLVRARLEGPETARGQALIDGLLTLPEAMSADFSIVRDKGPKVVDANNAAGVYNVAEHKVSLFRDSDVVVLLHEAVHAATVASLNKHIYSRKDGTRALTKEGEELVKLYETAKQIAGGRGEQYYGLRNVREFVAEAFSNQEFQEFLASIPYADSKKSMWDKFVQLVNDMLRMFDLNPQEKSLLNAVIGASAGYMKDNEHIFAALVSPELEKAGFDRLLERMRREKLLPSPGGPDYGVNSLNQKSVRFPNLANKIVGPDGFADKGLRKIPEAVMTPAIRTDMWAALEKLTMPLRSLFYKALNASQMGEVASKYFGRDSVRFAELLNNIGGYRQRIEERLEPLNRQLVAHREKFPERHVALHALMNDATLADVAPYDDPATAKKYKNTDKEAAYEALKKRFNDLTADEKQIYKSAFDSFVALREEFKKALKGNISELVKDEATAFSIYNKIMNELSEIMIDHYFPLYRKGDFRLSYTLNGTGVVERFETQAERAAKQRELEAQGATDIEATSQLNQFNSSNVPDGSMLSAVMKIVKDAGGTKEDLDKVVQLVVSAFPETSILKRQQKRSGIPGYINDNAALVFDSVTSNNARQIATIKYREELKSLMKNMRETQAGLRGDASEDAQTMFEDMDARFRFAMDPDVAGWAQIASSTAFYWNLAGNVSSALVQFATLPTVVFPNLSGRYGSGKAWEALKAAKNLYQSSGFTRQVEGLDGRMTEEKAMLSIENLVNRGDPKAAKYAGLIEAMKDNELLTASTAHNALRAENRTDSGYGAINKVQRQVALYSSFMMHHTERMSREVTAVAAYDLELARLEKSKPNMDPAAREAAAVQEALRVVQRTHGAVTSITGTRIGQNSIGKIFMVFKNYAFAQYYNLFSTIFRAFPVKNADPDTLEDIKAARRQLVGMYGMVALFAGVKGVPLYWIAELAYNALTDDDEEDFDMVMRRYLGEFLFKGPVNYITNLSIADRVGWTDLIWRENKGDRAGSSAVVQYLESSFAPLSVIKNAEKGFKIISDTGSWYRGIETMLPASFKNPMKALRYGSEGANTLRGDPVMADINVGNAAMQALGFAPADLMNQYEQNAEMLVRQKAIRGEEQRLLKRYYVALKNNDFDRASDAAEKLYELGEKYPELGIGPALLNKSVKERERFSSKLYHGMKPDEKLRERLLGASQIGYD